MSSSFEQLVVDRQDGTSRQKLYFLHQDPLKRSMRENESR